ncbi:ABC transporter ATP-binding protein [Clostridium chauvoei]|uniref:ABC transporter ATP-binding protein n=2 Tax=Clostridium chauvoei TaxID=46867 RepID=A0ABD4RKD8_9CLOT|nr:ABC transporter ATP-binding protein [Clostridium chauvoei]ATD54467.1 ABC transporter ATP-binding protein [Clostridium chauvoei]ATD57849.1 ABC transporter ATP-binding protein [Clostridium chauvoei]MBX7281701.1 ABC transporter ATP-binding protein [Clostridium chauvoei]MBX7284238.1 ABC transporter ATP-binding protein [Clostridium chauvoei]MBX7286749.1 ABC transporter ATP-binding protein [Clostridium chauvoei]
MLRVEGLKKKVGDFILDDISFELKDGFIMGLIGPNGSGKTTLIKSILGLLIPYKGSIEFDGKVILDDEIMVKNNIGFVYDDLNFYSNLKVKDFEKLISNMYINFNSSIFNGYLERFNISKKSIIGSLSKGESMRLMLANALSHNARLLILDEPTAGLDLAVRKDILNILQEAIEDGDVSVLLSTHITSDLDSIADYITFINNGKLIFSRDMESIKDKYRIIRGTKEELESKNINFINIKKTPYFYEGFFINNIDKDIEESERVTLDDIMYHYLKGDGNV